MSTMSTLSVKILNPSARNIFDDLVGAGAIECVPYTSAIAEFQKEMDGVAEALGIRDEDDVDKIVADIRRVMKNEYQTSVKK